MKCKLLENANRRYEIVFEQNNVLEEITANLISKFQAELIENLHGVDQIYRKFNISGAYITLHFDSFEGIVLFSEDVLGEKILAEIYQRLKE